MIDKMKGLGVILCLFIFVATTMASDQWHVTSSKDQMTGEETWSAFSPMVGPLAKMGFPYGDTSARLTVSNNGKNEWAYFWFSNPPNLLNTEIKSNYNLIKTRIKWDDELEDIALKQEWGSKFIHFIDYKGAIDKMLKSNSVLLELNWFGEGKVYFEIPLMDSTKAIQEIRAAFKE